MTITQWAELFGAVYALIACLHLLKMYSPRFQRRLFSHPQISAGLRSGAVRWLDFWLILNAVFWPVILYRNDLSIPATKHE